MKKLVKYIMKQKWYFYGSNINYNISDQQAMLKYVNGSPLLKFNLKVR